MTLKDLESAKAAGLSLWVAPVLCGSIFLIWV